MIFNAKQATGAAMKPRKARAALQKKPAARKKNQGASRAGRKLPLVAAAGLLKLLQFSALGLALAGIGFAIHTLELQEKWQAFMAKPITRVQVDGNFHYLQQDSLREVVNPALQSTFFNVDLTALKIALEQNPWVDNASVAKQWPGTLIVKVVEQQPIARWGAGAVLNMRGDIIRVGDNQALSALPLLSGDDQYAAEVMQQYLRMGKLLTQAEMTLEALELDRTRAWTLTVDGGKTIKLGRDLIWEKLQHLTTAKKTVLATRFEQVAGVDLRYHNGLAVSWKQPLPEPIVAKN